MHKPFLDTGNKRGEMARLASCLTETHEDREFYDSHFTDGLAGWCVSNEEKGKTMLKASAVEPNNE